MLRGRSLTVVCTVFVLSGCSTAPTSRQLAQDAATAMGGADRLRRVKTVAMRGGVGSRFRLGQTVRVSDQEDAAALKNVAETLDLANGRAALDYELQLGPFGQHRQEVLTKKGDRMVGLESVAGRPLAVTSPSGLFSRTIVDSPAWVRCFRATSSSRALVDRQVRRPSTCFNRCAG